MRPRFLLKRAAGIKKSCTKQLIWSSQSQKDAAKQLGGVFGASIQKLPPSLRIELLQPDIQQFPHRTDMFQKLNHSGYELLYILFNEHLGTRNVALPEGVLDKYSSMHPISPTLTSAQQTTTAMLQSIAAVNLFASPEECRDMVRQNILEGNRGLSSIYLDALSNNEVD